MIIERNPNLQEVWDVQNVTLITGTVQFRENAKLCVSLIEDFLSHTNIVTGGKPVVDKTTNGYLAVCKYTCVRPLCK